MSAPDQEKRATSALCGKHYEAGAGALLICARLRGHAGFHHASPSGEAVAEPSRMQECDEDTCWADAFKKQLEAAEARVAELEKERDSYHERADAEQVAGIIRGEKAEKEASDLRAALRKIAHASGPLNHEGFCSGCVAFEALLSAGEHEEK